MGSYKGRTNRKKRIKRAAKYAKQELAKLKK
jgi:hypothetical protein